MIKALDFALVACDATAADTTSYHELSFRLNFRPTANMAHRPEIRYDWTPTPDYEEDIFGLDWVTTF